MYHLNLILLFAAISMSKLHISNNDIPHEMVMSKGMSIEVKNKTGTIRIEALDDLIRKYYWGSKEIKGKMRYRGKRWFGAYGAYHPGGGRDVHLNIEEGQQHFCSQQEAEEWLQFRDHIMRFIFTKDGLAVGWYKDEESIPIILSVDVIQIYVQGKKPVDLAGAQDSLFSINYSSEYVNNIKIGEFQPSMPKMIGQRLYSGKVIDIMKEQGINAERVEYCIENGEVLKDESDYFTNLINRGYTTYAYYKRGNGILLVSIDKDGRVVFVGT